MFGFFIGAACLVGLYKVMRHGRHHGFGPGSGLWGHRGRHGRHGMGGWGRRGLYRFFQRIDATPGQERVILDAISDLKEHARDARAEMRGTATEVAEAFRGETFDEDAFSGIFDAHVSRIEAMRTEFVKAVSKVHEALAPEQRERLADLLESRARFAHVL